MGQNKWKCMKSYLSVMVCKFNTQTGQTSYGNKHEAWPYYTMRELHDKYAV